MSAAWQSARGLGGAQGTAPVEEGRIGPEATILLRQYVWNVNRTKAPKNWCHKMAV
jgi:hypothetical protein